MSGEEYSTFVDETLEFVRTELLTQHQEGIDTVVERGVDIDSSGGGVVRLSGLRIQPSRITCSVDLPPSDSRREMYKPVEEVYDIYEGNTVAILWEDDRGSIEVLDGIVTRIDGRSIVIDDSFGVHNRDEEDLSEATEITVRVVQKGVAERREYEAFEKLSETSESLLRGESNIDFSSPLDLDFTPDLELNTYQERAAVDALCTDDVFCIHGPPGTGKTRTLVTIIENAVKTGHTVLVCAHSNQAVDNIVAGESTTDIPDEASLHRIVQRYSSEDGLSDISMVRIGSPRQDVDSFVTPRYYISTNRLDSNIGGADIIASTTNTAAVLEDQDDVNLDVYGEDLAQTLYRQYRMNESIAEFASQEFYDGGQNTVKTTGQQRLMASHPSSQSMITAAKLKIPVQILTTIQPKHGMLWHRFSGR